LYKYYFISKLQIKCDIEGFDIIKATSIFDDDQQKKIWWQSFMDSYRDKQFLRREWSDKFGLVPPPPPPPETTDWFKKEK
jgi:hypothetical protein